MVYTVNTKQKRSNLYQQEELSAFLSIIASHPCYSGEIDYTCSVITYNICNFHTSNYQMMSTAVFISGKCCLSELNIYMLVMYLRQEHSGKYELKFFFSERRGENPNFSILILNIVFPWVLEALCFVTSDYKLCWYGALLGRAWLSFGRMLFSPLRVNMWILIVAETRQSGVPMIWPFSSIGPCSRELSVLEWKTR